MSVHLYAMCVGVPVEAREGGDLGAAVTGIFEPFGMGSGSRTVVLWKNSKCSEPLVFHLSRP